MVNFQTLVGFLFCTCIHQLANINWLVIIRSRQWLTLLHSGMVMYTLFSHNVEHILLMLPKLILLTGFMWQGWIWWPKSMWPVRSTNLQVSWLFLPLRVLVKQWMKHSLLIHMILKMLLKHFTGMCLTFLSYFKYYSTNRYFSFYDTALISTCSPFLVVIYNKWNFNMH